MIRILILVILTIVSISSLSKELGGYVCLGKNLSIIASDHSSRLYITVGDSPKIYFGRSYDAPKIVVQNLDVFTNHKIKVYFDGKVVESWILNFSKLKTDAALIWRAKGSWRMEPVKVDQCKTLMHMDK